MTHDDAIEQLNVAVKNYMNFCELLNSEEDLLSDWVLIAHVQPIELGESSHYVRLFSKTPMPAHIYRGLALELLVGFQKGE